MAGAPTPRMHGLTHVPGGPDPIPGISINGGGELEWEDVGVPGGGFTDPWVRYATVTGTSLEAGASGELHVVWSALGKTYSPEGALCSIGSVGRINLLLPGLYDLQIRLNANSLHPSTYYPWGFFGTGMSNLTEYGYNIVQTQYAAAGGPTLGYPNVYYLTQVQTSSVPAYFTFHSNGTVPPWTNISVVALIKRLSI